MKIKICYLISLLILASCSPTRDLAYFSDVPEKAVYAEKIKNSRSSVIQEDDLLSISVTSLNSEATSLFNRGGIPQTNAISDFSISRPANVQQEGYLIDKDGYVEYPVIGKIKLAGLSKEEARDKLISELQEYLKDPIVNIRFLNFKISVIGEVNRPSTFTLPSERINILEALGMAGDMTPFGKRENVLIIREENGVRTIKRVNLNNSELLNSPFFYLRQNDVIYVEPNKLKQIQASTNTRTFAYLSAFTSIAIVLITRIRF